MALGVWRSIGLRAGTFIIALVGALALAEVAIRLSGAGSTGGVVTVNERDFERVPGIFEPGQTLVDRRIPQLAYHISINSLGYRGHEFPIEKQPGEVRVLMVGDSFTFGDFVDDQDTLPAQLESVLQCGAQITVVNAGVGGSTIDTQRQMTSRGLAISPDLVVLTFYENDVADVETPLWAQLERNRKAKSRAPLSIIYPVARHLAVWNLVNNARARWASRRRADWKQASTLPSELEAQGDGARRDSLRAVYAKELTELVSLLRDRDLPFILATYPSHGTLRRKDRSDVLGWVEQLARSQEVPVVTLLDPLAAAAVPVEALYALPVDGHPRPLAHRIAATHLAGAIRSDVLGHRCEEQ